LAHTYLKLPIYYTLQSSICQDFFAIFSKKESLSDKWTGSPTLLIKQAQ